MVNQKQPADLGRTTHCLRRLIALSVCALATACGSGSGSGSSNAGQNQNSNPPPPATAPEFAALAPTALAFDLEADATGNLGLSFANTGDATLTYSLATNASWLTLPSSGSVPAGGTANLSVTATCGSAPLADDIVLTTNDADEGTVVVPATATCTAPPPVTIERVLLNQAARGFDSDTGSAPNIRMLAGRETLVRAFVTSNAGPGVQVPPANVVITAANNAQQSYPMAAPISIGASAGAESILESNYYVTLPADALAAGDSVRVEVGGGANPARYPETGEIDVDPVDPGSFRITFVPVTFQGQTPSIDVNASMREALEVLPIGDYDVEVRQPYVYTGAYDLDNLLTEISDLRDSRRQRQALPRHHHSARWFELGYRRHRLPRISREREHRSRRGFLHHRP